MGTYAIVNQHGETVTYGPLHVVREVCRMRNATGG